MKIEPYDKEKDVNIKYLALFLVSTVLLISFAFYAYQIMNSANILVDKQRREVFIDKNDTFKDIQEKLGRTFIVNDMVSFSLVAKLMKYDENIKPGRYILEPNMTNIAAVRLLRSGERTPVRITFNNVRLIKELAPKITANLAITPEEFNSALANFISSNDYGFKEENIITMFIPNTYEVYYSTSAEELLERMHKEYVKFWNEDRIKKANDLGLSKFEVSILASIIQGETNKKTEKPIIAGLYLNRIKDRMPLQSCPTLIYAIGDFTMTRVYNKHMQIESPYNTYKNLGLPPGPISMPEISSIDAVLNYDKNNYLYMCAKDDFSGYHNFSENYNQHLVYAKRWQKALDREEAKARQANN